MESIERSKSIDVNQFGNRQISGLEFYKELEEVRENDSGTDSESSKDVSEGSEKEDPSDSNSASGGSDSEERELKAKIDKHNKGQSEIEKIQSKLIPN